MTIAEQIVQAKEDYDAVYDAGKQAEYDAFWDAFQANGTRENYEYAFSRWEAEYVRPKHKVVSTSRSIYMFSHNSLLKKVESQYFDLSKGSSGFGLTEGAYRTFENCIYLEEVEDIGMKAGYYCATWQRCFALKKIAVVRVSEESIFDDAFYRCESLEEIRFEGTIANDLNFKDCKKLTLASLVYILNHLKDFTGTEEEYTRTLTLSQASVDILNEDNPSWIASMLGAQKKWNLTVV